MLPPGTRFGAYEISGLIGAGGMGEVYRARDTTLGRDVAIKVLPDLFANDSERLARFEREAHLLASLNHPHIAQIYGFEGSASLGRDQGSGRALIMELVEGPALADRITDGPMKLDEAMAIARQIAEALDAAHQRGIVHRDLKPANIKLTADGAVKVLDFSLAKSVDSAVPYSMNAPTAAALGTQAGLILGTAAYMAPEQIDGRPADKRADIWAFGVVLYEMLAGIRLFSGDTMSETLRAVLTKQPDWDRVPPKALGLLKRCLERDPRRRLRDIGDAHFLLEEPAPTQTPARPQKLAWIVAAATTTGLIIAVALTWPRPIVDRPLMRLDVDLGMQAAPNALTMAAISRDGTQLAFPALGSDGKQVLGTRRLDQSKVALLAGTEGADQPFFSPDGQWLGFFAGGKLRKVSISGGTPVDLCDAFNARGGSWGDDDTIVAALFNQAGISRVSADGGRPQLLTSTGPGDRTHRWPQLLPRSKAVLFTARAPSINIYEEASIEVQSLTTGERKTLWRGGYYGRFLPTSETRGHLTFISRGVLFAVPFDAERLQIEGTPAPVADDVGSDPGSAAGRFDFSETGIFVYRSGIGTRSWSVASLDSSGNTAPLLAQPSLYYSPRFSPDGQRLAVGVDNGKGADIYVHDRQRDSMTRLTFTGAMNADAVWAPDGAHIAFRGLSQEGAMIAWMRADGSGEPQPLLDKGTSVMDLSANALSPDGRQLIYAEMNANGRGDLWLLSLDISNPDHPRPGAPVPLLRTDVNEARPAFSPDGRWIAYSSDESGAIEVYVRSFEDLKSGRGGKWQISSGGGTTPIWAKNGRELFYLRPDGRIMRAAYIANGRSFSSSKALPWSQTRQIAVGFTNIDLAPDGKRFAIFRHPEANAPEATLRVTVLLNFFDELRRRATQTAH